MFRWLLGRTPIDDAIDEEKYDLAIELIRDELNKDPRPAKKRPLKQQLAEIYAAMGSTDAAVYVLRELSRDYMFDGQNAKVIAIQKRLEELTKEASGKDLDDVAGVVSDEVKPIDLSPVGDDEEDGMTEMATTTIARTPLFGDMSKEEVRALIGGFKLQTTAAGDILMVEGEPGDSLFILTDGEVRVHVRNASGHTVPIRTMDSGSFFGEISIVYGKPRTATLTCTTNCEILELNKATLDELAKSQPRIPEVLKEFCDKRIASDEEKEGRESSD